MGVAVLMYHEVGPQTQEADVWSIVRRDDFARQLEYLRKYYEIMTLSQSLAYLAGERESSRPVAVITFDDGFVGNLEFVLPLIESLQVPVTVYVATGHILPGNQYWFDRIVNALHVDAAVCLDLRHFGLGVFRVNEARGASNWNRIRELLDAVKRFDEKSQCAVADAIESLTPSKRSGAAPPFRQLDIAGVQQIAKSPWVTIGAHSNCHRALTRLAPDVATQSIETSRALLQSWTSREVAHFAYPSGDCNDALADLLKKLKFHTACCSEERLWQSADPVYMIPRISIGRFDTVASFRSRIAGGIRQFIAR